MQWLVMGFEGTGMQKDHSGNDWRYATDHTKQRGVMTGSFVTKFVKSSNTTLKKYFPGPNIQGSDNDDIFRTAQAWYKDHSHLANTRICLVGYSRGAYIAMCFAKYLQDEERSVDFMGLFDPVSRDLTMQRYGTTKIAANVKKLRIAYRSPRIGSRNTSMNWIGETYEGGAKTPRLECPGSHGSLGGFPNGAGYLDAPLYGQGHPQDPKKFHPDKEFTAWWLAGDFISVGAFHAGVPVPRLVPEDRSKFVMPQKDWYSVAKYRTPNPNVATVGKTTVYRTGGI